MDLNPVAIVFWAFLSTIGYLAGGTIYTALIGLCVGLGISLVASLL